MPTTEDIRQNIITAFKGVKLDGGVSLKQARAIDDYCEDITPKQFDSLQNLDITDDWQAIPNTDLNNEPCIAHLDAKGFKYYIPRLMLSVLDGYDDSMRVIGTLSALYPTKDFWEYHMERYSELNTEQKETIAQFVAAIPSILMLDNEGKTSMERALKNYWQDYLK